MKKKKITYGVQGMMEYTTSIKIGNKCSTQVSFTDGNITAMGVNPAVFTTDNLMLQHAIEHSPEYARGLITTVRVIELEDEVVIRRNAKVCDVKEAVEKEPEEAEQPEESSEGPAVEPEKVEGLIEVEFSNNGDAKVYLEEQFGVAPAKLRNREIIEATAKSYGVVINWVG